MIDKQPRRTIVFGEQDEGLIKKLAGDIGCHYSKANDRTYNLNKFNSVNQSKRGVFAWVHKEDKNALWVSTRKVWVEQAKAKVLAGRKMSGINCFPKQDLRAEDSVCLDMKEDYLKTVRILSLINKLDS